MIVLITPTGARQAQFDLCSRWMSQQTYTGSVLWIIVDDCIPRTTNKIVDTFKPNWIIEKVFPVPIWKGINTQGRNLKAGIDTLMNNHNLKDVEAIFMIEDDDYYKPHYLEQMMFHLNGFIAVGETCTIYYNVAFRRFFNNKNESHASLFQTAFTVDAIPYFQRCYKETFIDHRFFKIELLNKNVNLFKNDNFAVGIKGMPGRKGIGGGHWNQSNMTLDINMNYFKTLIGDDTKHYEGYYRNHRMLQHGSLNGRRR